MNNFHTNICQFFSREIVIYWNFTKKSVMIVKVRLSDYLSNNRKWTLCILYWTGWTSSKLLFPLDWPHDQKIALYFGCILQLEIYFRVGFNWYVYIKLITGFVIQILIGFRVLAPKFKCICIIQICECDRNLYYTN